MRLSLVRCYWELQTDLAPTLRPPHPADKALIALAFDQRTTLPASAGMEPGTTWNGSPPGCTCRYAASPGDAESLPTDSRHTPVMQHEISPKTLFLVF
jgi:hypothetical protein